MIVVYLLVVLFQAQIASPFYTSIYILILTVINKKFPQIGELIVKHLILSFRRTYQQNDKSNCVATTEYFVNQNILHEIVPLEIPVMIVPRGFASVISTLRNILDESSLNKRTQYMIEVLFAVRKDKGRGTVST
ncbi:unnamed protein product [Rotaria sp. Silwood2]|nr:unnamed protein product [Rotaria sp. Silwood2]CAF4060840.1 unnamed protein product [Rotaria sp. Silwood2]